MPIKKKPQNHPEWPCGHCKGRKMSLIGFLGVGYEFADGVDRHLASDNRQGFVGPKIEMVGKGFQPGGGGQECGSRGGHHSTLEYFDPIFFGHPIRTAS